jgi:alkyl sulfatase BDS1-like metallo-beta-lactamase superfamily hydrolase
VSVDHPVGQQSKARPSIAEHRLIASTRWDPGLPAEPVNDHILMSRANSNRYLVTTAAGDVVINTGDAAQAPRHRQRWEQALGRRLDVKAIIFTQSHPDHFTGAPEFDGPGVEIIAQASFRDGWLDRTRLQQFFAPRGQRLFGWKPERQGLPPIQEIPEPKLTVTFQDSHSFELGGRRFELYAAPGGETPDSLIVWLPQDREAFTGNLMGALYGQFPHLYTLRGDRPRSALTFIRCLDRLLGLSPGLLITGHDEPVFGADKIRADVTKVRDMTRYVLDQTVRGMNDGNDLWTLMREIRLPPELQPLPGRGPISWYVRTIWEEYTGWFRSESTTELYAVPERAIWGDLAKLAGGPDPLVARATEHQAGGRPMEALRLVEIALAAEPGHRAALEVQRDALDVLLAASVDNFDELRWLETELSKVEAAISASAPR